MAVPDDDTFEALVDNGKSDSANLDSVVELLVQSTKSPKEALMLMVPEAFRSQPALKSRPEVRPVNLGTDRSYCLVVVCIIPLLLDTIPEVITRASRCLLQPWPGE